MDDDDDGLAASVRATDLGRALREVLCAYATPERADRLLHVALERAGRVRLPSTPRALRSFVSGDLHGSVAELLGEATASSVVAGIEPIVRMWGDVTRTTRSTAPAPRGGAEGGKTVALLSEDPALHAELCALLPEAIEILAPRAAPELGALVASGRCVLMIDLRAGISPALGRLAPGLAGARAVAWGDDPASLRAVRAWLGEGALMAFPVEDAVGDLAPVLEAELEHA